MVNKTIVGTLLLVILTASIYVMLPDKVRIDVERTRTKYSIYENDNWELAAYEYMNVFDGSAKMRAKSRSVVSNTVGNLINITRVANYKDNITTIQTYTFDGDSDDVENVPVSQVIECINCQGKIVHFEYRNILYTGESKDITSPFEFGHQMKLEWQDGSYRSRVYQQIVSDKIILRYRAEKERETYLVRLFDPELIIDSKVEYERLYVNITEEVKKEITYNCTKTKQVPVYINKTEWNCINPYNKTCEPIIEFNKTICCNVSWNQRVIDHYINVSYNTTCKKVILVNETIGIKYTGEIKRLEDDAKIKYWDYFCGLEKDNTEVVCDEYKDTHGGGADGNGDGICQKGETCIERY